MKTERIDGARRANEGKAPALRLKIEQRHIDSGVRGNPGLCAAAQALLERDPLAEYISCSGREIAWTNPVQKIRFKYFPTAAAAKRIAEFDDGIRIKPTTLNLDTGVFYPSGWQSKHPNSTRSRAYKRPVVQPRHIRYTRKRVHGECVIAVPEDK